LTWQIKCWHVPRHTLAAWARRLNCDTAVATFVFCVVPDPVQGLRELNRVVKPGGRILLLEHVRVDKPVIGFLMDLLNPLIAGAHGPNINRRTVENVKLAGLNIERIENLGLMQMVKLIIAQPSQ
jgi:ubiquinone/menaquinone biosynthesis C-methylase UbiE